MLNRELLRFLNVPLSMVRLPEFTVNRYQPSQNRKPPPLTSPDFTVRLPPSIVKRSLPLLPPGIVSEYLLRSSVNS